MTPEFDRIYESIMGNIARGALLGASLASINPKVKAEEPKVELKVDQNNDLLTNARQYIGNHEGVRYSAYKDSKGNWTIGIGHKILPGEKFESPISQQEVDQLFTRDIQEHLRRAQKIFPKFNEYNIYRRIAILDGVYRGDLPKSPKTIQLIKAGNWEEAAREYLNSNEYRKSKQENTGIWKRMLENAELFVSGENE